MSNNGSLPADAERIVDVMGVDHLIESLIASAATVMDDTTKAALREAKPAIRASMGKVYAETYTAEELRDILAFFEGPTGRALKQKQPIVERRIGEAMQSVLGSLTTARPGARKPQVA